MGKNIKTDDQFNFLGFSTLFETEEDDDEQMLIKGFASVERLDRSKDEVSPLEFNLPTFLNTGSLLVNHKRVLDELGNERTAGRVNTANPVIIHSEKDDLFVLNDLKTGAYVNTFPKSKVPELTVGDKGLFITARVTQPSVKARIKSGELGGLSWRGMTRRQKQSDGTNKLRGVDLIEISAVDMPDQNQSTLSVFKSVDGVAEPVEYNESDIEIYKFRFPKDRYGKEEVSGYADKHGLNLLSISENEEYFFGSLKDSKLFDTEKTVSVPMGDVSVFLAPKAKGSEIRAELVQGDIPEGNTTMAKKEKVEYLSISKDALSALLPGVKFEAKKEASTLDDGTQVDVIDVDVSEVKQETKVEPKAEAPNQDDKFDKLLNTLIDIGTRLDKLEKPVVETPKAEVEPKEEKSLTTDEVQEQLRAALEKSLAEKAELEAERTSLLAREEKATQDIQKVARVLESMSNITPKSTQREETVVVEKSHKTPSDEVDFTGWFN